MAWVPNSLDSMGNYTYDISVHQCRRDLIGVDDSNIPACLNEHSLLLRNAQNAKYNIQSMNQTFKLEQQESRIAGGTVFNMNVFEPNGMSLLSKMVELAEWQKTFMQRADGAKADVHDHYTNAFFIVTISFVGRDAVTNQPIRHPNAFRYKCTLRDFGVSAGPTGTNYSIELVGQTERMKEHSYHAIKNAMTVNASTFGEFVDNLNAEIEKAEYFNFITNESMLYPDARKVTFDESIEKEWRSWTYNVDSPEADRDDIVTVDGEKKKQFHFKAGDLISSMALEGIKTTEQYGRIIKMGGGFFHDEFGNLDPSSHDGIVALMNTFPEVSYGPVDELRGERQVNVEFRMAPHAKPGAIPSHDLYREIMADRGMQRKKYNSMRRLGHLKKKYDFMYGKSANVDVLELDCDFNNLWRAVHPAGRGATGVHEKNRPKAIKSPEDYSKSRTAALLDAKNNAIGEANLFNGGVGAGESIPFERIRDALESHLNEVNESGKADVSYPLPIVVDNVDPSSVSGPRSDGINRLLLGAITENMTRGSNDMFKIELGIRGDPFWLGNPSSMSVMGSRDEIDENLADFEKGEPVFYLHVNFPHANEDSTGRRKPDPDFMMSGLFVVISVISKYENGTFTQFLEAKRILMMESDVVNAEISEAGDGSPYIDVIDDERSGATAAALQEGSRSRVVADPTDAADGLIDQGIAIVPVLQGFGRTGG